jgi:hypothetical protein
MRGIRIVYLVLMTGIVAVAMSGCNRQAMAVMDLADTLLDERPDSAKVLLAQINPDRFILNKSSSKKFFCKFTIK